MSPIALTDTVTGSGVGLGVADGVGCVALPVAEGAGSSAPCWQPVSSSAAASAARSGRRITTGS